MVPIRIDLDGYQLDFSKYKELRMECTLHEVAISLPALKSNMDDSGLVHAFENRGMQLLAGLGCDCKDE